MGDSPLVDYPYPVTRIARQPFPIRLVKYGLSSRKFLAQTDLVYTHTIDLPLWGKSDTPRVIKIVGDQAWERCIRRGWIPPTEDVDTFQHSSYRWRVSWQQQSRNRQVQAMDGVIVPSEYLKSIVMGWGVDADKIHVVYNALPPRHESLNMTHQEAREQLDLGNAPLLFMAARLTPWKGVDHVIHALKQVPDVHLIVAGDGTERTRLQELAQPLGDRVQFLGKVEREKVALYMKACDYFVLYSGYEGLPHTILESLREGTPVIASDKGGNPEVVQDGVNGFLVPYIDIEALAETIRNAFSGNKRAELAQNHSVGMERFAFETMVERTHQILRDRLEKPRK